MKSRRLIVFAGALAALIVVIERDAVTRWWVATSGRGTARMVDRLDALARSASVTGCADAFRASIDERVSRFAGSTPLADEARQRLRLGLDLIKVGRPEQAAAELDRATQAASRDGLTDHAFVRELDLARVTAWLRLGEVENCVECCNGSSCLAPIAAAGVHTKRRGSERAYQELLHHLADEPTDADSVWLVNLVAMTLGTWPDGVPPAWRLASASFESEYSLPRFENVAAACGVTTSDLAGGAIAEDLDGDGRLDLLLSSQGFRDPLRLYRNEGNGRFTERSHEAGLDGLIGGLNLLHADYDNDGDVDVLVLRGAWLKDDGKLPNSLLRNRGDGTFDDVTEQAGMLSFHPTQNAVWSDFDGDGWLDLFVGNETTSAGDPQRCELWWNDREGGFQDVAETVGVDLAVFAKGSCSADYDDDGRPDLYVSCREPHNFLFRNVKCDDAPGFRFVDVTAEAGVARPEKSFACWFFDYDQDGRLDLFAAPNSGFGNTPDDIGRFMFGQPTSSDRPALYRNEGHGRFRDVAPELGLDRAILVMGANYGDLDNDGWEDIYLGTGNPSFRALLPNRMFRNDGARRFQDVTTAGGFGHLQKGHGIAFADFDDDGDQDVCADFGGIFPGDDFPSALFENPTQGAHWITLHLRGVRANHCAIGARLKVELETPAGPRTLHRLAGTGGSFGGSSLRQEIGLGDATAIRSIEIRWPGSGTMQRFTDVPFDRAWRVTEGEVALAPIALRPFHLGAK